MSEISSIRAISRVTGEVDLPRTLRFHISLGYSCNFNCEYCIQRLFPKRNSLQEEIDNTYEKCELINTRLSTYVSAATNGEMGLFVTFIGGEPSLYPIDKYLEILKESFTIDRVSLVTNLSADIEWYRQLGRIVTTGLTASYHGSQMPIDEFKERCLNILNYAGCALAIQNTITGTEENSRDFQDLIEFGKKYNIQILPRLERISEVHEDGSRYSRVKDPSENRDNFTNEILITYKDGSQKKSPTFCNLNSGELNPCGMWCSIASEALMLRYSGDLLYNLSCKTEEGKPLILGNIYKGSEPFQYNGAPLKCNADYCYCQTPRWLRDEL